MLSPSAFSLTHPQWSEIFIQEGASLHLLPYWLDGLYNDKSAWEKHVSVKFIALLKERLNFSLPEISTIAEAQDGTVKFLMKFHDQLEVETVLIPFHKRFTVCLSTQVGCAMNCSFCYTGTQGLKRNLSAGEIVGQYLVAQNWLKEKNKKELSPNIVFMGQGEPLHNLTEVSQAIKVFNDTKILGLGRRQMTLSTVGYLPALQKIQDFPKINIALSLHSPFEEERVKLIPINERYPLTDVMTALDDIPFLKNQYITFEYLLIKDFNMSDKHVEGLSELLGARKAILNLIPFNPFPGSNWDRPSKEEIENFRSKLVTKKLRVMVRTTKGSEILAACGQLKVNKLARKNGTH
jgi:23S rRNA (adenine2503-C2)-methyltransferase